MLYIRGHKIIKGYIGNAPVSHVGFGKSGLIKIKSENGGSDYPNNLIAKYTTNASGVLPTFNSGYQYTINETESNGIYTVEISSDDDFTSCSFNEKTELLTVDYLKVTDKVTTMNNMFRSCSKLTQLDVSNWDTSEVINMSGMFYECKLLTALDLSNFNTSQVTTMSYMFCECKLLTALDLSNFNTSQVTNMNSMFNNCSSLTQLDVSNFDTSQVTSMSYMFTTCSKLTRLDVSNFDTNKVTNMSHMFYNCSLLASLDISNFDTNKVTNNSAMFGSSPKLVHIIMTNSDYNSVNKIIAALPTRTGGCLDIAGVDDISLVDEETLNSKNWTLSKVGH